MKKSILIFITSLVITNLYAQSKNPSYSQVTKNEKLEVTLVHNPPAAKGVKAAPAILVPIIKFVPKALNMLLTKQAKKFNAGYSVNASFQDFYENPDSYELEYDELIITRSAELNDKEEQTLELQMKLEASIDKSSFRLVPSYLKLMHAKAKVKSGKIDLAVKIEFTSIHTNDKGISSSTLIGETEILFKNTELGKTYSSIELSSKDIVGNWLPVPPKSVFPKNGSGNISMKISVVETDNFGKRYEAIAKFFGDNADGFNSIVMAALE